MTKLNSSILSYPSRGKYGDSKYRGNCSGFVIRDLIDTFKPKKFVEVFSGGGTGKDVAREKGYANSIHLDLNNGWDAMTDAMPTSSDFVFSHPPYFDIIDYNKVRGEYNQDDLSNKMPYADFIQKLDQVNEKIYNSLENLGRHAILIGDVRQQGHYFSIVKDMTWFGDLTNHLIKEQFNTQCAHKQYNGTFIPISHEHLLVFQKNQIWEVPIKFTKDFKRDLRALINVTWADLIKAVVEELGGTASLQQVYIKLNGCRKADHNQNWQAKIRQELRNSGYFKTVSRGNYQLA